MVLLFLLKTYILKLHSYFCLLPPDRVRGRLSAFCIRFRPLSPDRVRGRLFVFCLLLIPALLSSCNSTQRGQKDQVLTVFHAGSLSAPLRKIAEEFESQKPGVEVQLEAAGSVTSVRKITDLDRLCDVIALADFSLIDRLLIPDYTSWALEFASNELCLVYNEQSMYADELSVENWFEILVREDVRYGRSDPNSDPCGYRTVLALKLADRYYSQGVNYKGIIAKDRRFIRPKETDLLALMETNTVDYIFEYTSVAVQHNLQFLNLPDSINLGNPLLSDFYAGVSVEIAGKKPGTSMEIKGQAMVYGLSIPNNSPNPKLAGEFVRFIIDQDGGLRILKEMGQQPLKVKLSPGSLSEAKL